MSTGYVIKQVYEVVRYDPLSGSRVAICRTRQDADRVSALLCLPNGLPEQPRYQVKSVPCIEVDGACYLLQDTRPVQFGGDDAATTQRILYRQALSKLSVAEIQALGLSDEPPGVD